MDLPFAPLLGFAVAMAATPGPNNIMVAAAAAAHGLRPILLMMAGMLAGAPMLFAAAGFGLAAPLAASPLLHAILKWVGGAWLLLLAFRIATTPPPDPAAVAQGGGGTRARPPMGFLGAALFQWVNPKAWIMVLGAISAFTPVGGDVRAAALAMAMLFALVGVPCVGSWALVGLGMGRLVRAPRAFRAFNRAMAALLALSLLPALWPSLAG